MADVSAGICGPQAFLAFLKNECDRFRVSTGLPRFVLVVACSMRHAEVWPGGA